MAHDTESRAPSYGSAPPPALAPSTEPPVPRRLTRSRRDRVVAGVCGGVGEYLGVDAVLIRIVTVALALSGGAGFLLYLVAWIALPEGTADSARPGSEPGPASTSEVEAGRTHPGTAAATIAGGALVAVGTLMLLNRLLPWVDSAFVWPVIVLAGGVAILLSGRRRT